MCILPSFAALLCLFLVEGYLQKYRVVLVLSIPEVKIQTNTSFGIFLSQKNNLCDNALLEFEEKPITFSGSRLFLQLFQS